MRSLAPDFLDNLSFNSRQLETLTTIGNYQGKQALYDERLPDTLATMRNIAKVESAESSNRIEGIEAPRKRIQSIALEYTSPANRSEQENTPVKNASPPWRTSPDAVSGSTCCRNPECPDRPLSTTHSIPGRRPVSG